MRTDLSDSAATGVPAVSGGAADAALSPRVLIVAENASYRFGGEAVLPLHYFRVMRARNWPVWLITNARNKTELEERLPAKDWPYIHYVPDSRVHVALVWFLERLPNAVGAFTAGQAIALLDQRRAVRLGRKLIAEHHIDVVHQPTPVSPKHISAIRNLGVPVVMGPMNGGISYPRGFRQREHRWERAFVAAGRLVSGPLNRLIPGKRRAATLLVANTRTRDALPGSVKGRVEHLVENGVDLSLYNGAQRPPGKGGPPTFVFAGRLIDLKGVDLLLRAMAKAIEHTPMKLAILGDGVRRQRLEVLTEKLGLREHVNFHGWLSHAQCADVLAASDAFVLPSLRECGGAVVLEAMAMRLPVIATNWGGPADYIDPTCGILVDPLTPDQFIDDLAAGMTALAGDPERRRAMGDAGYAKILREYDWERKVDKVLGIYRETIERAAEARGVAAGGGR